MDPPDSDQQRLSGAGSLFPNMHEHWWYEGPFEFQLNLTIDRENAQVVTVDERNETGAGWYSVSKTLSEIAVETDCSEERKKQRVIAIVLDGDGKGAA